MTDPPDTGFSPEWLALREPFDHAARSVPLARRFAERLPACPELVDLACGRGSGARFVAAHLCSRARWQLWDHDPVLLAEASASGLPAASLECRVVDLRESLSEASGLRRLDGVVTQALLDLVSHDWLVALADWLAELRVPFLAGLTVDGRVRWTPPHPLDAEVQAAFVAHQSLDRGFGPSPGPRAATVLGALLAERGFGVEIARADWQVPPEATAMLSFMVDGTAEAAAVTHPEPQRVAAWQAARRQAVAAQQVGLMVGHLDLFAWPRG